MEVWDSTFRQSLKFLTIPQFGSFENSKPKRKELSTEGISLIFDDFVQLKLLGSGASEQLDEWAGELKDKWVEESLEG